MKLIPLTKGYFAQVDDEDFEWLSQWKWQASVDKRNVYAITTIKNEHGKRKTVRMHRLILGVNDPKILIDHWFQNGLDNQRKNLRTCTLSQNQMNRKRQMGSSRFKGVSWNKTKKRWCAHITLEGRLKSIGHFTNERLAAERYDEFAREHFGQFASLNFLNESPPDINIPEAAALVYIALNEKTSASNVQEADASR